MERPTTYYFENAIPSEDGSYFLITLLVRSEPDPWEYVKSFFGLFGPIPYVEEMLVTYMIGDDGKWYEAYLHGDEEQVVDSDDLIDDPVLIDYLCHIELALRKAGENQHAVQQFMHR